MKAGAEVAAHDAPLVTSAAQGMAAAVVMQAGGDCCMRRQQRVSKKPKRHFLKKIRNRTKFFLVDAKLGA